MSDKIAEIRARHTSETWRRYEIKAQMHDDRGYLLAEVERLTRERDEARAEVARLRAYVTRILLIAHQNIVCRTECGQLCRDALEGKP